MPASLARCLLAAVLLLVLPGAVAGESGSSFRKWFGGGDDEILPVERAFALRSELDEEQGSILLHWDIAKGYYLYRDKFLFEMEHPALTLGEPGWPAGERLTDPIFGDVEIYRGELTLRLPVGRLPAVSAEAEPAMIELLLGYQGCKENSICYPPQRSTLSFLLVAPASAEGREGGSMSASFGAPPPGVMGDWQQLVSAGGLLGLLAFLGLGLVMAFTPCVFPMIPILAGIVVGARRTMTPARGLLLTSAYVLAMSMVYALFGAVAAIAGFNLQAAAQQPWAITVFSAVLVALSLAMFGVYELQLPAAVRNRLHSAGSQQQGGSLGGAAAMGALAALIAGPCVLPPVLAALLIIQVRGDVLFGAGALFAMGLGFGLPLLLVGASAGALLPRAGAWMERIRQIFGVAMLGVAIWFMQRILPGWIALLLWGALLLGSAAYLGALEVSAAGGWRRLQRGLGLLLLVYGAALVVGAAGGNGDPLRPLESFTSERKRALPFKSVRDLTALREELAAAVRAGRPTMVDFYADWCVSCQALEKTTFSDRRVHDLLRDVVLLKVDVTGYNYDDRQMLREFGLIGPPAVLFFDRSAKERRAYRLFEFVAAEEFLVRAHAALQS